MSVPQGYEVFHFDGVRVAEGDCWGDEDGNAMPAGWYWWSCQPGCLPDGDPTGPFDTEDEAIADLKAGLPDEPRYDYEWLGYGLEITGPEGSVFLQGDEADTLHDELEAIEDDEVLQSVLSQYSTVMGDDN